MKLRDYLIEESPTPEMVDFYEKRTANHINRVQKNIQTIIKNTDIDKKELLKRSKEHDKSKYSKKEREPYIWLTWWYKEKGEGRDFKYPDDIKDKVKNAAKSHVKTNLHHPEAHSNPNDMSDIDIAEMVADWAAMSQELGTSLKGWTDKNVGSKWKFNDEKKKLIYDLIGLFE